MVALHPPVFDDDDFIVMSSLILIVLLTIDDEDDEDDDDEDDEDDDDDEDDEDEDFPLALSLTDFCLSKSSILFISLILNSFMIYINIVNLILISG
jgi:hypothetical protein